MENASIQARDKKHIRITVRDLELGVRNDKDLNKFFIDNNISFLGGGVVPYIHPNLLVKKQRKRVNTTEQQTDEKKKHRYRPGTVSIREIKNLQKNSTVLTFAKFPFEKLVRKIVDNNTTEQIKISKEVFVTIQYFIEQQIVHLLQQANFAAIHAGRVKLIANDINFITNIKKYNCNPLINNTSSLLEINNDIISNSLPHEDEVEGDDEVEDEVEGDEEVEDEEVEDEEVEDEEVEDED